MYMDDTDDIYVVSLKDYNVYSYIIMYLVISYKNTFGVGTHLLCQHNLEHMGH